jgi:hypothetical protein
MGFNISYVINVQNSSYRNFSMEKLEWNTTRFFIPARSTVTINESVPFCSTLTDIRYKAFLLRGNATTRDDGQGRFYLFKNDLDDVCWCRFEDPTVERAFRAYRGLDRFNLEIRDAYEPPPPDYLLFNTNGIYTVSG